MFICNFAYCAHHLVKLTHKGAIFEFRAEQIAAQEDLKLALLLVPAM
jgi:alpha-tubulin suppressor-like RCC1 family protein